MIAIEFLPVNKSVEKWYQVMQAAGASRGKPADVVLLLRLHYSLRFEGFLPHSPSLRLSSGDRLTVFPRPRKQSACSEIDANFIDYFLVVGVGDTHIQHSTGVLAADQPRILQQFPEYQRDVVTIPPHIALFCFPNGWEASHVKRSPICYPFSFMQECGTSRMYGAVLMFDELELSEHSHTDHQDPKKLWIPKSLCVLSRLPFYSQFCSVLIEMFHRFVECPAAEGALEQFLTLVCLEVPAPQPGGSPIHVKLDAPLLLKLPAPFYDFSQLHMPLQKLFQILDIRTIVQCVCGVLCESRVVLHSSQYSLLTFITESILALCYPLVWSHIYIPVLPKDILNVVEAPVPFIVGIHSSHLSSVRSALPNECLVLDVEASAMEVISGGGPQIPSNAFKTLNHSLRQLLVSAIHNNDFISNDAVLTSSEDTDRQIRLIWLRFLADVLQDYRQFLFFVHGETPIFNTAMFLQTHPKDAPFLSKLTSTSMFHYFLEEHIDSPSFFEDIVFYTSEDSVVGDPSSPLSISPTRYRHNSNSQPESKMKFPLVKTSSIPTVRSFQSPPRKQSDPGSSSMLSPFLSRQLSVKSSRESKKKLEENRLYVCVDRLLRNEACPFGELSAVGELLAIPRWRTALTGQLCAAPFAVSSDEKAVFVPAVFDALAFLVTVAADHCGLAADYVNARHLLDCSSRAFCSTAEAIPRASAEAAATSAASSPKNKNFNGRFWSKAFGKYSQHSALFSTKKELNSVRHTLSIFNKLSKCEIWSDTRFWDYVFDEELSSLPPDCDDSQEGSESLAFSVISSICYTMLNLRLCPDMVTAVVIKLCTVSNLGEAAIETLINLVGSVAKCIESTSNLEMEESEVTL